MSIKPKILIVSLEVWPGIARLPKALQEAGFEVAALCSNNSFLAATRCLHRTFLLRSRRFGQSVSRQLTEIISQWMPQLIIPGDDRTVIFFQRLIQLHRDGERPLAPDMIEVLRGSFGNFDWQCEATSKRRTLLRAQELGLKTPRFATVTSVEEAVERARGLGWPVIVKKSMGWGGGGVALCENESQVTAIYCKYSEASRWIGHLKSRLLQLRGWRLSPDWLSADHSVTVNEVIRGRTAMIAVTAASGKILTHATALKLQCHPQPNGPSSVVQFIDHPGILRTTRSMVSHWGASGFLGFDFMLSDGGEASLSECNPRPTPLSHMGRLSGSDLCLALRHYLAGLEMPVPTTPRHEVVAHFPQEWRRDSQSPYLFNAYHDVPWDDPGLLAKLLQE